MAEYVRAQVMVTAQHYGLDLDTARQIAQIGVTCFLYGYDTGQRHEQDKTTDSD